ncbi:transposable element Tcb2 transposase [Trichonephila clavipes]|uniref:Transposable element Tcb2 transposase n=1 Tax=Trichonephila clavipes TaxID=2585209 RepID=A0A8X7BM22_TRICX|nr:transposable element Tcb2 transposase [Trichonephila clavipes]
MIAFIRALKVLTRVDSCCFKSKFYRKDLIDELKIFGISSRHHIDDFMRGRIIGKIEEGRKITDVLPGSSTSLAALFHGCGSHLKLLECSRRHGEVVLEQVANQFLAASGKQISRKTVARRLRGGGLYARRPVVCVPLTRQHRTARLQWCREHHNCTEQDWACVLFSDESRFSLSSDCRRQLIWRESGTAYRPENIQEKDRYPTCSIMVWAGIMINVRKRLHVVANGTMTGQRYIDEVLLPHVRLFRGAVGDKFVFMDDNATCHRTLTVQVCLDSEGIQRLVWPARSPDLNPIENVWDALGRQVAGRNYPPTNKNTLIRELTEEWDKLPQQLLDNVVQNSEVNCGKHIEKIADKSRKRLKILKYLSGRDWGSDASTLRITYITLVRPVLEYGYQIFQVASPTNLKKLERVQLSAARIITGLRYSCPTDIVLYEADIQPLTMRFEVNSYRYFNKIKSLDPSIEPLLSLEIGQVTNV